MTTPDTTPHFSAQFLKRNILPSSLTDTQKQIAIAAIRNPDADIATIADLTNVMETDVRTTIAAYCEARRADIPSDPAGVIADRTDKQRDVMQWFVLHNASSNLKDGEMSRHQAAGQVVEDIKSDQSEANVLYVLDNYSDDLARLRLTCAIHHADRLDGDPRAAIVHATDEAGLRVLFEHCAETIPDHNLDAGQIEETESTDEPDTTEASEATEQTELNEETDDTTEETESNMSTKPEEKTTKYQPGIAERTTPEPEHVAQTIGGDSDDLEYEYVQLEANAKPDDLEIGVRYLAEVSNIPAEKYGVFVDVAPDASDYDNVTALVHKSKFPPMYRLDDFSPGDTIGVMLIELTNKGPAMECVAVFEADYEGAPHYAPQVSAQTGMHASPSAPSPQPEQSASSDGSESPTKPLVPNGGTTPEQAQTNPQPQHPSAEAPEQPTNEQPPTTAEAHPQPQPSEDIEAMQQSIDEMGQTIEQLAANQQEMQRALEVVLARQSTEHDSFNTAIGLLKEDASIADNVTLEFGRNPEKGTIRIEYDRSPSASASDETDGDQSLSESSGDDDEQP